MTCILGRMWVAAMIAALIGLLGLGPALADIRIAEITSQRGVKAWIVEDYSAPLIAISFAFRGGSAQDPDDREGVAYLMSGLMDEGAGILASAEFQRSLDEADAEMSFVARTDSLGGRMRMLRERRQDAFALLAMAVKAPRFDQEAIDRIRDGVIGKLQSEKRDPRRAGREAMRQAMFGTHPYARDGKGDPDGLRAITRDDLKAYHAAQFARANLRVVIVGAISPDEAGHYLDEVFGDLPAEPAQRVIDDATLALGRVIPVPADQAAAELRLAYPGVRTRSADYFTVEVMGQILGGASFSSRLFQALREKGGLVYHVSSSLSNMDHADAFLISTETRPEWRERTLAVIGETLDRLAKSGPTEDELRIAKRYLIGSYFIDRSGNSMSIANALLDAQLDGWGPGFLQERTEAINAVTAEAVTRMAGQIFGAAPLVLVVGPK